MTIGSKSKGLELEITLQSVKPESFWIERILTVKNKETNTSRVVIHLHAIESKVR